MLGLLMEAGFGLLQYHTTATIMNDVTEMLNDKGPNAFRSPTPKWKTEKLSKEDTDAVSCNRMAVSICYLLADFDPNMKSLLARNSNNLTVDTIFIRNKEQKIDVAFSTVFTAKTIVGIWMVLYQGNGKNRLYHMYPVYVNNVWYPTEEPYVATVEKRVGDDDVRVSFNPY